jgi:hypothetical protein
MVQCHARRGSQTYCTVHVRAMFRGNHHRRILWGIPHPNAPRSLHRSAVTLFNSPCGSIEVSSSLHDAKVVIAIDIDPVKISCAKHNAAIYGVLHKIEFIQANFFTYNAQIQADAIFISPPWGGPSYNTHTTFDVEEMKPYSAYYLLLSNLIKFLPHPSCIQLLLQHCSLSS